MAFIDLSPFCIVGKRKNRDLAIHEDYLLADGNGVAFDFHKKCIRIFPADLFQHLSSFVLIGVDTDDVRSEERRVGKECRSRWSPYH